MNHTKEIWIEKVSSVLPQTMHSSNNKKEIQRFQTLLCHAPKDMQKDADVVFAALTKGKEYIKNIDTTLLNDKNFIMRLYSYHLQNEKNNAGYHSSIKNTYENLPSNLRHDVEIIQLHIKTSFSDYEIKKYEKNKNGFDEELLKDKHFILKFISKINFYDAIKTYHKNDIDVTVAYLEKNSKYWNQINKVTKEQVGSIASKSLILSLLDTQTTVYSVLPENMKLDAQILDKFLIRTRQVDEVPKVLLKDKEFVKKAIEQYDCNLLECDKSLHNDQELIELFIKKNPYNIQYKQEWKNNPELAMSILSPEVVIDFISKDLLKDKNILTAYIKSNKNNIKLLMNTQYKEILEHYCEDLELLDILVDKEHIDSYVIKRSNLLTTFKNWQNSERICQKLFEIDNNFEYWQKDKLNDKQSVLKAIKSYSLKNYGNLFNLAINYRSDKEIVMEYIKNTKSIEILKFCPLLNADSDFMISVLKNATYKKNIYDKSDIIKYIDPSLLCNKKVAQELIRTEHRLYSYLTLPLKNDMDIVYKLIKSHKDYHVETFRLVKEQSFAELNANFYETICQAQPLCYQYIPMNHDLKSNKELVLQYITEKEGKYPEVTLDDFPKEFLNKYNVQEVENIKVNILYYEVNNAVIDKVNTVNKRIKL